MDQEWDKHIADFLADFDAFFFFFNSYKANLVTQ